MSESNKQYYLKNKETILAHKRAYYILNKERIKAYKQTPKVIENHRLDSAKRRRVYGEKVNESNRKYNRKIRAEFIAAYGGTCECCNESYPQFLHLDHINHDGKRHRAAFGGVVLFDLRRRGWPKDSYRLLCANCNLATRYPGDVCPHKLVTSDEHPAEI